jgi:hypothetical protein
MMGMGLDPHRLAELRSLAYHRAVAERLDQHLRSKADAFIARELARGTSAAPYLLRWRALLAGPEAELEAVLTSDGDEPRALRSASPFPGALTPKERWALWRAVREATE